MSSGDASPQTVEATLIRQRLELSSNVKSWLYVFQSSRISHLRGGKNSPYQGNSNGNGIDPLPRYEVSREVPVRGYAIGSETGRACLVIGADFVRGDGTESYSGLRSRIAKHCLVLNSQPASAGTSFRLVRSVGLPSSLAAFRTLFL